MWCSGGGGLRVTERSRVRIRQNTTSLLGVSLLPAILQNRGGSAVPAAFQGAAESEKSGSRRSPSIKKKGGGGITSCGVGILDTNDKNKKKKKMGVHLNERRACQVVRLAPAGFPYYAASPPAARQLVQPIHLVLDSGSKDTP